MSSSINIPGISNLASALKSFVPAALSKVADIAKFVQRNKDIVRTVSSQLQPVLEGARNTATIARDVKQTVDDVKSILTTSAPHLTPDEVIMSTAGIGAVVNKLGDAISSSDIDPETLLEMHGGATIPLRGHNEDFKRWTHHTMSHPLSILSHPTKVFQDASGNFALSSIGSAATAGANGLASRIDKYPRLKLTLCNAMEAKDIEAIKSVLWDIMVEDLHNGTDWSRDMLECALHASLQIRGGGLFPLIPILAGIGTALSGAGAIGSLIAKARGGTDPRELAMQISQHFPEPETITIQCETCPGQDITTDISTDDRGGVFFAIPALVAALASTLGGALATGKAIHANVVAGRSGFLHPNQSGSYMVDQMCEWLCMQGDGKETVGSRERIARKKMDLYIKSIADSRGQHPGNVTRDTLESSIMQDGGFSDEERSTLLAQLHAL